MKAWRGLYPSHNPSNILSRSSTFSIVAQCLVAQCLVAQCRVERVKIISPDPQVAPYGVVMSEP